jgi:flagellin-like protein
MSLVLLIILLLLVVGALPTWGYHEYGYGPSGIGGVILLVLIVLLLTGRI